MDKNTLEKNLQEIISYNNRVSKSMQEIYSGIENNNENRQILDEFLDYIGLEKNKTTRLGAYFRIIDLQENSLVLYMEENDFSLEDKNSVLNLSYEYVSDFYLDIQEKLISFVEENNLVSDFYLEIIKGTYNVGKNFNQFFLPWRNYIVNGVNNHLEDKFDNNADKIIDFLNENNLFDLGHDGEIADRSYSSLILDENGNYFSKSYFDIFKLEVNNIVKSLDKFIKKLSKLEDEIYNSKEYYINYLEAIKQAFLERDVNKLVYKWSLVDEAWMYIKTPFQISHPLEFYEDKYRKSVAPEWDLRILNQIFESEVETDIENMYEKFYDEIGRENYKSSYDFSKSNIKRVQLYLSTPILYFSSELTGLFSAQVVPNDEIVSDKFGKKIFAFPEMILENKRNKPFMALSNIIFDEKLLDDYRKYIFGIDKVFYKVYDVETIGHEFGHTLWLDLNTQSIMNNKTGIFKNIEEFKATAGGLVSYFVGDNSDLSISKNIVIDHVIRSVGLLSYKKVNEVEPYYCEALIHLSILFESGIIYLDENKVNLDFNDENYKKLKQVYIKHYKKLIDIYLNKIDANEFLKDYAVREGLYFMPLEKKVYDFVSYYYENYKKHGNELDKETSKDKYIKINN